MVGLTRRGSSDKLVRVAGRMAAGLLALVFGVLVSFNIWTTATIRSASERAQTSGIESAALQQAKFAVSEEESLERKYRLDPSSEWRAQHQEAAALLKSSLQTALTADKGDSDAISGVLAIHGAYLLAIDRMFNAVDAGNATLVTQIDTHEVDPVFNEIVTRVTAQADVHRVAALGALRDLNQAEDLVARATPIVFAAGLVLLLLISLVMRGYQGQIRRSGQRFRSLVQNASDTVAIVEVDGTLTYVSPTSGRVLGRQAAALEGTNALALVHPDDTAAARALIAQVAGTPHETITTEVRIAVSGGDARDFELIATNLQAEPAVEGIVLTYRDISERKAFERQLKDQAFTDVLTRLPNRALFLDRLEQAIARANRHEKMVAVIFLDIDNFKIINDSLGHARGDQLLAEVGLRLRATLRQGETLARLGGDEFTILLEDLVASEEAAEVAERVMASFKLPVVLDSRQVPITASIGIALNHPRRIDADTLLRNADLAMYRAKADGRACYRVFDDGMEKAARERLGLQEDLGHALDRGEFRVFYQPIVSLTDSSIVEFEALLRWDRPNYGITAPETFIPLAEETGLIVPLGLWVLDRACRQGIEWQERQPGKRLTMCVNLSARQFQQPTLQADIAETLKRTGLAPESLKLEITESVAMRDPETTARTLRGLKALGVRIAIDDFGTGYSSLAYLQQFPIDTLKIDRSFVSELQRGAQGTAIAQSIIALARTLDVQVTAEGVETRAQEAILQSIGCDLAQGYLFGHPLPSGEAEDRMRPSVVITTVAPLLSPT